MKIKIALAVWIENHFETALNNRRVASSKHGLSSRLVNNWILTFWYSLDIAGYSLECNVIGRFSEAGLHE